ncbi:MAG: AbrB/MazE/SpoVT family DNA-binding domain-containing protein [Acidobacteriota bacterium]|nr:AbrB/MazE/SpoVT family DNA-binding domain-containing protein [Acidobacteriota bacterium]
MLRVKTKNTAGNVIAVMFPAETLQSLGIYGGDEIDVTATGDALILRPITQESFDVQKATEKVFSRWDKVFTELAKGTEADK